MRESDVGLVILNSSFEPLAANREAVRILAFPTDPEGIRRVDAFLSDKLRTGLIVRNGGETSFVSGLRSGKRQYTCSAFRLEGRSKSCGDDIVLLMRRPAQRFIDLSGFWAEYDLTPRERESVELLVQGLTTKDIAERMHVSASTVSAFLRLVMVKVGANSRSGIVGKVVKL
jgi:DNA-binding CsgD family transcriptional regulator